MRADAADGYHRDGNRPADGAQGVQAHVLRVGLGTGGEHRAHAQVVRAVLLGKHGLFHSLRRNAEDFVLAQQGARLLGFHIALAHVYAVRVDLPGERHVVVDDEGHAVAAAQGLDFARLGQQRLACELLFAQLHEGRAAPERLFHLLRQRPAAQPGPVGDRVEQQIFFIALHNGLLFPAWRHPCYRSRQ